jgi:hypothetical protein
VVGAAAAAGVLVRSAAAVPILEASPATAVTVSAPPETAAAAVSAAATPVTLFVLVLRLELSGRGSGYESTGDLALEVDSKFLLESSAGQEVFLPLPGRRIDSEDVVHKLHEFRDSQRVVF